MAKIELPHPPSVRSQHTQRLLSVEANGKFASPVSGPEHALSVSEGWGQGGGWNRCTLTGSCCPWPHLSLRPPSRHELALPTLLCRAMVLTWAPWWQTSSGATALSLCTAGSSPGPAGRAPLLLFPARRASALQPPPSPVVAGPPVLIAHNACPAFLFLLSRHALGGFWGGVGAEMARHRPTLVYPQAGGGYTRLLHQINRPCRPPQCCPLHWP